MLWIRIGSITRKSSRRMESISISCAAQIRRGGGGARNETPPFRSSCATNDESSLLRRRRFRTASVLRNRARPIGHELAGNAGHRTAAPAFSKRVGHEAVAPQQERGAKRRYSHAGCRRGDLSSPERKNVSGRDRRHVLAGARYAVARFAGNARITRPCGLGSVPTVPGTWRMECQRHSAIKFGLFWQFAVSAARDSGLPPRPRTPSPRR